MTHVRKDIFDPAVVTNIYCLVFYGQNVRERMGEAATKETSTLGSHSFLFIPFLLAPIAMATVSSTCSWPLFLVTVAM